MEELPVPDGRADVVISNGVLNLTPDKQVTLGEMFRVLRPGGRLQIGDMSAAPTSAPAASTQPLAVPQAGCIFA